jgi:hypothetical protein
MKKTFCIAAMVVGILWLAQSIRAEENSDKAPWESNENSSQNRSEMKGPPPMMGGGGGGTAVITVSHGNVYVLMGNRLLKFDEKTLKLDNQIMLPRPEEPQGGKFSEKNQKENRKGEGTDESKEMSQGSSSGKQPMHRPMMGGGGGSAMTDADGFLFVVSQGKLFKYSAENLELKGSADLQRSPRGDDQNFSKSKDQPSRNTEDR